MADPFEVRVRFSNQLHNLNASVTSAQRAANYALKYRDMDEDLHSCILEQLEKGNNMNNRANIMFFLEHLCDLAQRENHMEFVRMMQRDILRIIDAVAPADGSGAANVRVVRKVLEGLQQRQFLEPQTVVELEECLRDRDIVTLHPAVSPESLNGSGDKTGTPYRSNGVVRLDKRQIETRIEEDRERHKKARENIWAIDGDAEHDLLWEEEDGIAEDDYLDAEEDALERRRAIGVDQS